jgi:hypothetical protein
MPIPPVSVYEAPLPPDCEFVTTRLHSAAVVVPPGTPTSMAIVVWVVTTAETMFAFRPVHSLLVPVKLTAAPYWKPVPFAVKK